MDGAAAVDAADASTRSVENRMAEFAVFHTVHRRHRSNVVSNIRCQSSGSLFDKVTER